MTSAAADRSRTAAYYACLEALAPAIEARYRQLTPTSAGLHREAAGVFPGGSTRDALLRHPYGPFVASGAGSVLIDADGRELVDFWFNATALPLGHGHPSVVDATARQLRRGVSFFANTASEIALGREICQRLPSAELVRFVNSGSEAVMLALRLARAYTGRDLVAKFEGNYHGSYDDVLWSVWPASGKTGPPERPHAVPATEGLPSGEGRVLVLPGSDLAAARAILEPHLSDLAAVIIEPLANRLGLVPPPPGLLAGLRDLCDRQGAVLIFDEVMAFRAGFHGAQGVLGVVPHLTALGKIIGGGLPIGAVAGREDVMLVSAPDRTPRVSHYGTFNANALTMVAGLATLEELTPAAFDMLNARGDRLRAGLTRICAGLPLQVTGSASMFKVSATPHAVCDYRSSLTADAAWQETAALALLNEGFLVPPQLRGCLATNTTEEQIDALLDAFERIVRL